MEKTSYKHYTERTGVFHTYCCGVRELYNLQRTPEETLQDIFYQRDANELMEATLRYLNYIGWLGRGEKFHPHVIFHDFDTRGYGLAFAEYIQNNLLGKILVTEARKNLNSGNMIRVFVWSPDYEACRKLLKILET